jgi:hypothetical protein
MATRQTKAVPEQIGKAFSISGYAAAAAREFRREVNQRQGANGILKPNVIEKGVTIRSLLMTTLGGVLRPITHADLAKFKKTAMSLGKKLRGGVTANDVLEMALKVDLERANKEIKVAIAVRSKGPTIQFVTNAGPNNGATRHHVIVTLLNYSAAMALPEKPAKIMKALTEGHLKYDCDCGRHRFWYRYIATIGQFNAGRDETGFPKIRNPKLVGIACKHVLRVMHGLQHDAGTKAFIARMVEHGRNDLARGAMNADVEEIRDQLRKQATGRRKAIAPAATPAAKVKQAAKNAVKEAVKRAVNKAASAKSAKVLTPQERGKAEKQAKSLMQLGLLTAAQFKAMMAGIKSKG